MKHGKLSTPVVIVDFYVIVDYIVGIEIVQNS